MQIGREAGAKSDAEKANTAEEKNSFLRTRKEGQFAVKWPSAERIGNGWGYRISLRLRKWRKGCLGNVTIVINGVDCCSKFTLSFGVWGNNR